MNIVLGILAIVVVAIVWKSINRGSRQIEEHELTQEEKFMQELYDICGYENIVDMAQIERHYIRKPKNRQEWKPVVELCKRYGYNPDELFRHKNKPFFNYFAPICNPLSLGLTTDGTLTLEKISPERFAEIEKNHQK